MRTTTALLLCLAPLALSPAAAAEPVVTAFFGDSAKGEGLLIEDDIDGVSFSIDGDGTLDLNLAIFGVSVNSVFAWDAVVRAAGPGTASVFGSTDANDYFVTARFAQGDMIGPGAAPETSAFAEAAYWLDFKEYVEGGPFLNDPTPGYLGFSFQIGDQTHYGWAEITVFTSEHMLLHRFGYETEPGTPVPAGAGGEQPADLDGDGDVDSDDLGILLDAFGTSADGDIDGDADTDFDDLGILLAAFNA